MSQEEGRYGGGIRYSVGVGIVVALVLVNAFFVAAEYALVRVRRTRMETLPAQGSRLAKVVLHGLHYINRYIAGVQVGITLAGLASGRFGELALAALFDRYLPASFPPHSSAQRPVRRLRPGSP
jgi:CBS domain containing-hemolysin-like protein